MKLFKKVGRRYVEAEPAEVIHASITHVRESGYAELAAALEVKLLGAVFVGKEKLENPEHVLP